MTPEIAIEAVGLCKQFGTRAAVKDVNLNVPAGAHLLIFGANGAGKTTLLRMLATLSRPTSGTLHVAGLDARENADAVRAHIGFISHNSMLYENLTAEENLVFFANLYGITGRAARTRAREMLDAVELSSRRLDCVRTFSRGMTQRLSIARAFIHDPDIVFLDEPYSGLDPHACGVLDNFLQQMCAGKTLVQVSHNLQRGLDAASHVLVLKDGRVVESGTREEVNLSKLFEGAAGANAKLGGAKTENEQAPPARPTEEHNK